MLTQCTAGRMDFHPAGRRQIVADFDAGRVTSDAGALLLSEVDHRCGMIKRFAACFVDHRSAEHIEHSIVELLRQRIYGLCLGYEDVSDHDTLRDDALLAAAIGKADPTGAKRTRSTDRGHALAGKSTLNRLELAGSEFREGERYKKIIADDDAIERFFVEEFVRQFAEAPERLVLDIDPTDIKLHGNQEDRIYHGYYGQYCYLPLLIFCGDALLWARLRPANIDGSLGTVDALAWLVPLLRAHWPDVEIVLRADSGFARETIFAWCEEHGVEYVIGIARNERLASMIHMEQAQAEALYDECGEASRVFAELSYRTRSSWSRPRRVVAKAEQLPGKKNPRFIVSSYSAEQYDARTLYEDLYCQRGEAENRIKEYQLDLFGDRASCSAFRANQIRLWLSAVAYCLFIEMKRVALAGTCFVRARSSTIRLRLLKVGALVTVSFRRVKVSMSSVFPLQDVFRKALAQVQLAYAPP